MSYSQIIPDSLIGTYVGEYWFSEWNNPWEVSINDTVWVFTVDTSSCKLTFNRSFDEPYSYFGGWNDFETSYNFCTGNSDNFFKRFYGTDSLFMKIDEISPPPPDYNPISIRYYGKKVSSKILSIPFESNLLQNVKVYPNPFNQSFTIKFSQVGNYSIKVIDSKGAIVYVTEFLKEPGEFTIHFPHLAKGIYYLQLINKKQSYHYKLIKQ